MIYLTPKQFYWTSIEVICSLITIGIFALFGLNLEERESWILIAITGTIFSVIVGILIAVLDLVSVYMGLLNSFVYFFLSYGVVIFVVSMFRESVHTNVNLFWVSGNIISAIVSTLFSVYKYKRTKNVAKAFVDEHISS